MSYAERHAPTGLGATAQGIFSAALYGVAALGSVLGGLLYASAGPVALFQVAALMAGLALLAFLRAVRVTR